MLQPIAISVDEGCRATTIEANSCNTSGVGAAAPCNVEDPCPAPRRPVDRALSDSYHRLIKENKVTDWNDRLEDSAQHQETKQRTVAEASGHETPEVQAFYADVVIPAFEEIQQLLRNYGREVNISPLSGYSNRRSAKIEALHAGTVELELSIDVEVDPSGSRASARWTTTEREGGDRSSYKDNPFEESSFFTSLSAIRKEQVLDRFMAEYMPIFERSGKPH
jgi:hypothetical protein